jgi:hypothetical protein
VARKNCATKEIMLQRRGRVNTIAGARLLPGRGERFDLATARRGVVSASERDSKKQSKAYWTGRQETEVHAAEDTSSRNAFMRCNWSVEKLAIMLPRLSRAICRSHSCA